LSGLELDHLSRVIFQLLGAEQHVLLFTLLKYPVKHEVVELGAFLENGQSEGGLHIPPVEEPVHQEVSGVC